MLLVDLNQPQIQTMLLACIASMGTVITVLWKYNSVKEKKIESIMSLHAQEYKEMAKENIAVQRDMANSNTNVEKSVERLTASIKDNSDKITQMMIKGLEDKK